MKKTPGHVIKTDSNKVKWSLSVHCPVGYEKIEIFVNGKVVWNKKGSDKAGSKEYNGSIEVPNGGWVTARISGGIIEWPLMDSYPFAETSPIWFKNIGSIDSEAANEAAQDLLKLLDVSENRLKDGYKEIPIPKLLAHFEEARQHLISIIKNN